MERYSWCDWVRGLSLCAVGLFCLAHPLSSRADYALNRSGWDMTMNDEFGGTNLKWWIWNKGDTENDKNQELQWYTPDNVFVENGNLVLKTEERWINDHWFASGKVTSDWKFDQQYGYFEIRAQLPRGQGIWPAHWMLGYNGWPPEIDITEMIGSVPWRITTGHHWGPLPPGAYPWDIGQTSNAEIWGGDWTLDFHTFAIEWDWWGIKWFIDGNEVFASYGNPPREKMWLILNTAVGGTWAGWPDWTTPWPQWHLIDYVRVWQRYGDPVGLNLSFEEGNDDLFADWNTYNENGNIIPDEEPANARSGARAVQMFGRFPADAAPSSSYLYQSLNLGEQEMAQVGLWVANREGDTLQGDNHAQLKLEFLDAWQAQLAEEVFTIADSNSPSAYTYYAIRQRAPGGTAMARITIAFNQFSNQVGAVTVDDAELFRVTEDTDRPILNGDFEWVKADGSFLNWNGYGGPTNLGPAAGTGVAYQAETSLRITGQFNGSNNFSGVFQDIPARGGEPWVASVYTRPEEGNPLTGTNEAFLKIEFTDWDGLVVQTNRLTILDSSSTNAYMLHTLEALAPSETRFARLVLEYAQYDNGPGACLFDAAQLVTTNDGRILLNPGLELHDGSGFPGWQRWGAGFNVTRDLEAANARSGTNAVQMFGQFPGDSSGNESGMYQDINAEQGEVWQASVWAQNRLDDPAEGANRAMLKLEFLDGGGGQIDKDELTIITSNSPQYYQEFVIRRSAPTNTAKARIVLSYIQENNANGSVNFDDAELKVITVHDDRPVLNGSFEWGDGDNFVNWPSYGDTGNIIKDPVPANAYEGTNSVQMYGQYTGNNDSGLYQDFPAQELETWQATVWAQPRFGDHPQGDNSARLKIEFVDEFDNLLATNQLTIIDAATVDGYTNYIVRRQAPWGTTRARMVVEYRQAGNADGSVNFDAAEMKLVTALDSDRPLLNPGFEIGEGAEFANWVWLSAAPGVTNIFRDSETTNAQSGAVALQLHGAYDGDPNSSFLYQDIPAREGEIWHAAISARNRPGDGLQGTNAFYMKLEFLDYWGNFLQSDNLLCVSSNAPEEYAYFGMRKTAPPGTAYVRIVLQLDQVGLADGSVNADDAELYVATAETQPPLLNGHLEYGSGNDFLNWTRYDNGSNVIRDPTNAPGRGGSASAVQMFGVGSSAFEYNGIYQDLPAVQGQLFRASVWARNRPGDALTGDNKGLLKLEFLNSSYGVIDSEYVVAVNAASATNYQRYAIVKPAPAGTAVARIVLEMQQVNWAVGSLNFDDADLEYLKNLTGTQGVGRVMWSGLLNPGIGEAVTLGGDLVLDDNLTMNLVLGGTNSGTEYDQVLVTETAQLNGVLNVDLSSFTGGDGGTGGIAGASQFIPEVGDRFEVLKARQVNGTFASVHSPTGMGGGAAFTLLYTATSVVLELARELDSDNDFLPDRWEYDHFGSLKGANPMLDSDADSQLNVEEYISDTIPTNANSYFWIEEVIGTNLVQLSFNSSTGRIYTLQSTYDLWHGTWTNHPLRVAQPGLGGLDSVVITNESPDPWSLYRMKVNLP